MSKPPSEAYIVRGIRQHDSAVLEFIYQAYFPLVEGFVIHHEGSREQAKDVFQEAMIIAYRNVRKGDFQLTCKFSTYLYGIGKKVWIQERRKLLLRADKLRQQAPMVQEPEALEDPLLQIQLKALFDKHFAQLSPDCQRILRMFFNLHSIEEIRKAMDYKDIHHAADRKYRCKKSLIRRMMNDPLFKRLRDEAR